MPVFDGSFSRSRGARTFSPDLSNASVIFFPVFPVAPMIVIMFWPVFRF
jgi:hypothetical protein